jgi:hypothetical protein
MLQFGNRAVRIRRRIAHREYVLVRFDETIALASMYVAVDYLESGPSSARERNMKRFLAITLFAVPFAMACGPRPIGGSGGSGGSFATGGTFGSGGSLSSGGTGGSTGGSLPCDVAAALQSKCDSCHSNPPRSGAPFALVTYSDVQSHLSQVSGAIALGSMPPFGSPALTASEKAALQTWISSGAPATSCP